MPRKNKMESITGIPINAENKLIVQKSLPLISLLRKSNFTLAEFKILDAYLARIDSRQPEKRAVRFEKGELERILEVDRIRIPEMKERLDRLFVTAIIATLQKEKFKMHYVSLFQEAKCELDEKTGLWQIDLVCSQPAMDYIFNIESIGYLRYKLRSIARLKSLYSYILFLYLEQNRFRRTWEIELDRLKQILTCENEETYMQYKRFNDRLLKRCQNELHEKTDCRFRYEPVKEGRLVVAVRFTIDPLPAIPEDALEPGYIPEQLAMDNDNVSFFSMACCPYGSTVCEFSRAEMEEITELLNAVPPDRLPNETVTNYNSIDFRLYHYLAQRYRQMNRIAETTVIKNRAAYLRKMIKNDAEID